MGQGEYMNDILNSEAASLGINDFLNSAEKFTNNTFTGINIKEIFYDSLSGNIGNSLRHIGFIDIISKEFTESMAIVVSVLIVIIIHSIFKAIIEGLDNSGGVLITTVVINSLTSIIEITKLTIENIISFMNLLIPLLTTLMLTTGMTTTTVTTEPVLLFMINFFSTFINSFIIPMLLISITISIVSNFSDKVQLTRLSNFFESSIIWLLGIVLTIFASTLSLQGTLTNSIDTVTNKTVKAAVANFIPVVGKIMGDTVDSVIGCANILKNSVGIIGIIIIIGIVFVPIIKVLALWLTFKITASAAEIISDTKIVNLLDKVADSYKVLLAILFSVSIMFIVGLSIVLKITNSSLIR